MSDEAKSCFVIMPFGDKTDVDGKVLDFDEIYESLIRSAIEGPFMGASGGPKIQCVRCDKIAEAGWVHRQMISHILDDDVAVVDLSTLNPNVFYELGVRHALRQSVTVLLRRKGTKTPFNLQGFKCIDYDPDDAEGLIATRKTIAQFVSNGLNGEVVDSLVYEVLKDRQLTSLPPERVNPEQAYLFRIRKASKKRIGILTGDLRLVVGVDVWVNSENTDMQMARYYDRSGSAVIRYFGAKRDRAGQVVEDTIANELRIAMGTVNSVTPGTVLITSAGELERTNGVKRIFHTAAVQGQPGIGYKPVPDVEMCIREALKLADSVECATLGLRSMLFPIIGTGTGGAQLNDTVRSLLNATINYFEQRPRSLLSTVYFLAFTDQQLKACLIALSQMNVDPIETKRGPRA